MVPVGGGVVCKNELHGGICRRTCIVDAYVMAGVPLGLSTMSVLALEDAFSTQSPRTPRSGWHVEFGRERRGGSKGGAAYYCICM